MGPGIVEKAECGCVVAHAPWKNGYCAWYFWANRCSKHNNWLKRLIHWRIQIKEFETSWSEYSSRDFAFIRLGRNFSVYVG